MVAPPHFLKQSEAFVLCAVFFHHLKNINFSFSMHYINVVA